MHTHEYSKHLGLLSPDQFQAALNRFSLGNFLHAEPIPFGLFGQNVFLTSSDGEFVLRGRPHFPWQFSTEQFFARQLHERTEVPVPWPYLVDPLEDIFGWSYVIMPRMQGLQLTDPEVIGKLGEEDRRGIARAMGENLALQQELTWPFAGRYDTLSGNIQPFDLQQELAWPFPVQQHTKEYPTVTYSGRIVAQIRQYLASSCRYNDHTTLSDIEWVEELLALAGSAPDDAFQPCFVMEDYKEQNVVMECVNASWRVSGVFDLMEAHFGDGEADLSRTVAMYLDENPLLAQEFIQAYIRRKSPRPGFAERFPVYMLHDRLIIWEYFQRIGHVFWEEDLSFQDWASPYTFCLKLLRL
jgi:aminoglycoside phosphotransferase (APT) family kinase protein